MDYPPRAGKASSFIKMPEGGGESCGSIGVYDPMELTSGGQATKSADSPVDGKREGLLRRRYGRAAVVI